MTLPLLLDSATTTVTLTSLLGVYIALGGTLAAASLAAFASFRASNKASATAREVAELSIRTAQELKDKDYKNDFYKKVIDKRLKAIEMIEKIISPFTDNIIVTHGNSQSKCLSYFAENLDTIETGRFNVANLEISSVSLWCTESTFAALNNLIGYILQITIKANKEKIAKTEHPIVRLRPYIDAYSEIIKRLELVEDNIGKDMKDLYDVEKFLNEKYSK